MWAACCPSRDRLTPIWAKASTTRFRPRLSLFSGAIIFLLILLIALNPPLPSVSQLKSTPAFYYTGGIYGVIFVTTILMLAPRIGIANTLVATIIGQLIISVILDHFGVFGLLRHPINGFRLLGCAGLMVSLYLIQKTG